MGRRAREPVQAGASRRPRRPEPRLTDPKHRTARPTNSISHARLMVMALAVVALFGALLVRVAQIQAVNPGRYVALGESQRVRSVALPAARGSLLDRNGNDLSMSVTSQTVWADPRLVIDPAAAAGALAPVLGVDAATLADDLGGSGSFSYLFKNSR